jgi:hypothetical protein
MGESAFKFNEKLVVCGFFFVYEWTKRGFSKLNLEELVILFYV